MAVGQLLLKSFWSIEDITADDAGLEPFLVVRDGQGKGKGIPAVNQDFSLEVHFSGREDRQDSRVVMKLSERSPYQEIYGHSLSGENA